MSSEATVSDSRPMPSSGATGKGSAVRAAGGRAAILDLGFIPTHWVYLWRTMNAQSRHDFVVFYGDAPKGSGWIAAEGPFDFPSKPAQMKEISVLGWRPIWMPVVREILFGRYDVLIMCHELKFLSNLVLLPLGKVFNKKIIYWGFGYHADLGLNFQSGTKGWVKRGAAWLKDRLARFADGYLAYTERGRERMIKEVGLPPERVWVVRQTGDAERQIAIHARYADADPAPIRAEFGLRDDSRVVIFLGRLVGYKHVDELIQVVKRINGEKLTDRPVEAIVVGDGADREKLEAEAGGDPSIRFAGAIVDHDRLARLLRVTDAVVVPGLVGITITHTLAHGVPLITREHAMHSPEMDYMRSGENGLTVPGDLDAFTRRLAAYLNDPDEIRRLSEGALRSRADLSVEHMCGQFDKAVSAVLGR